MLDFLLLDKIFKVQNHRIKRHDLDRVVVSAVIAAALVVILVNSFVSAV